VKFGLFFPETVMVPGWGCLSGEVEHFVPLFEEQSEGRDGMIRSTVYLGGGYSNAPAGLLVLIARNLDGVGDKARYHPDDVDIVTVEGL
jgi:hypothetical protein